MIASQWHSLANPEEDVDRAYELDVSLLQEVYDPFLYTVWDIRQPVTEEEIRKLLSKRETLSPSAFRSTRNYSRVAHMRRIAWLVLNVDPSPISVDVGIPSMNYRPKWGIEDGNHRFVASLIRGDATIAACCSGEVEEMLRLTGCVK